MFGIGRRGFPDELSRSEAGTSREAGFDVEKARNITKSCRFLLLFLYPVQHNKQFFFLKISCPLLWLSGHLVKRQRPSLLVVFAKRHIAKPSLPAQRRLGFQAN